VTGRKERSRADFQLLTQQSKEKLDAFLELGKLAPGSCCYL